MGNGNKPDDLRGRVVAHFLNRCSYCLAPQHLVYGLLEMEHIKPTAKGGGENETNLCLACRLCNNFKGVQTHGLDPVTGLRTRLFRESNDGADTLPGAMTALTSSGAPLAAVPL
jgi:5-methylcytosine-specific restriction endonuclease McrA